MSSTIGTTIFANIRINVNAGGGVYRSTDDALTWVPVNNGINPNVNMFRWLQRAIPYSQCITVSVLVVSCTGLPTWAPTGFPSAHLSKFIILTTFNQLTEVLLLGSSDPSYNADSGYVCKSLDNGSASTDISPGLPYITIGKMKILNGKVFVAPIAASFFTNASVLPLTFTSISANHASAGIKVSWVVATESGIRSYEVERSSDGHKF